MLAHLKMGIFFFFFQKKRGGFEGGLVKDHTFFEYLSFSFQNLHFKIFWDFNSVDTSSSELSRVCEYSRLWDCTFGFEPTNPGFQFLQPPERCQQVVPLQHCRRLKNRSPSMPIIIMNLSICANTRNLKSRGNHVYCCPPPRFNLHLLPRTCNGYVGETMRVAKKRNIFSGRKMSWLSFYTGKPCSFPFIYQSIVDQVNNPLQEIPSFFSSSSVILRVPPLPFQLLEYQFF